MMPRFVHKVICTSPVDFEDGTVLVSISDKSSRTVRANYPLQERVIKEFKQSQTHKDRIAEFRDAFADPTAFELRGIGENKADSDLLNDHAIDPERASMLLTSPVEAFRVAQIWRRARQKKIERFGYAFRKRFFKELAALVSPECASRWSEAEPGIQLSALDAYLEVSAALLEEWKRAGKLAARWWNENPADVFKMHQAQECVRRTYTLDWRFASAARTSMPWEIPTQPVEAQTCLDYGYVRPALLGTVYLLDQNSIRKTARSASYLVFRQLLIQNIVVSICAWCEGVFEVGKKTKYCCDQCGNRDTSSKARADAQAQMNLDRVMLAIELLNRWFECIRANSQATWRKYLEGELLRRELSDANSHGSQIVGVWINAAYSQNGNDQRKLARLCTTSRLSCRTGAKTVGTINYLLALIALAETTGN